MGTRIARNATGIDTVPPGDATRGTFLGSDPGCEACVMSGYLRELGCLLGRVERKTNPSRETTWFAPRTRAQMASGPHNM
jgi:hypothetical protein